MNYKQEYIRETKDYYPIRPKRVFWTLSPKNLTKNGEKYRKDCLGWEARFLKWLQAKMKIKVSRMKHS